MSIPWILEQQRTAALDAKLALRPVCDVCGYPITSDKYLSVFDQFVCPDCVSRNTFEVEEFDDE